MKYEWRKAEKHVYLPKKLTSKQSQITNSFAFQEMEILTAIYSPSKSVHSMPCPMRFE